MKRCPFLLLGLLSFAVIVVLQRVGIRYDSGPWGLIRLLIAYLASFVYGAVDVAISQLVGDDASLARQAVVFVLGLGVYGAADAILWMFRRRRRRTGPA